MSTRWHFVPAMELNLTMKGFNMLSKNGTSEIAQRTASTQYDPTAFKLHKRDVLRRRGFKEDELQFPEVAIEESQPMLLPVIDSIVRVCIQDVEAAADVTATEANALINNSLARIHFNPA